MEADMWDQSIVLKTTQQKKQVSVKPGQLTGKEEAAKRPINAR